VDTTVFINLIVIFALWMYTLLSSNGVGSHEYVIALSGGVGTIWVGYTISTYYK